MEQKIFTTDESRIRSDLTLTHRDRWLRSALSVLSNGTGVVFDNGYVNSYHVYHKLGVLPACTI